MFYFIVYNITSLILRTKIKLHLLFINIFFISKEFINNLRPIIKKVIDASDFNITSGTNDEIDPPVNAPSRLAKTSAEDEPNKTASGLLEVPLIVRVANCVLSPNSAINTVINVDNNRLSIIYM